MPAELKFILFQMMVILPFIAGFFLKKKLADPSVFSRKLVRVNIIALDPLIALWSIWGLDLSGGLFMLPAAGILLSGAGFLIGLASPGLANLENKSRKTFLISSCLANHGFTMGGFICYLIAGEKGLGLAAIFVSYFLPFVFTIVFPYAASSGHSIFSLDYFRRQFISLQNMPLYAVIAAICLKSCGINRPENFYFPLDLLIALSIILYYLTLGTNFSVKDLAGVKKLHLGLAVIKFFILPAAAWATLQFVHLDPAIEMVILIQSFMPAAIYSVVTSILYDLDTRLASGLFVANTLLFIIIVLPAVFMVRGNLLQ